MSSYVVWLEESQATDSSLVVRIQGCGAGKSSSAQGPGYGLRMMAVACQAPGAIGPQGHEGALLGCAVEWRWTVSGGRLDPAFSLMASLMPW